MKKLYIIKIGGHVLDQQADLESFLDKFKAIDGLKILVHGGGSLATKIGHKLGMQPHYIDGRRITDDATIELVTMVYGGLINKKIVALLQARGCNAIGLTGADANMIPAVKRPTYEGVDFGWVGDIVAETIPASLIASFLEAGLTPVFASLTHDGNGQILNTNADTIAATLASALCGRFSVRLMYCFEKPGILEDMDADDSVISFMNQEAYCRLLQETKLSAGILPKLDNAFVARDAGVKEVWIGHAADILENVQGRSGGTWIQ
jgi:acetylglutamate kinase